MGEAQHSSALRHKQRVFMRQRYKCNYRLGGIGGKQVGSALGSQTGMGPLPPATMTGPFCLDWFGMATPANKPANINAAMAIRATDFMYLS